MKLFRVWLPVLIWAGLIFLGSSLPGASVSESRTIDFAAHKIVHLFEYSVLFILVYRAVKRSVRNLTHLDAVVGKLVTLVSFGLTIGYAVTDEIHQLFVRGRDAKFHDVIIDAFAALLGWLLIKHSRLVTHLGAVASKRVKKLSRLIPYLAIFLSFLFISSYFVFSKDILSLTVPDGFELKEGEIDHLASTIEVFETRGVAINFKPDFNFDLAGFATFVYSYEGYYGELDPSVFSLSIYEGLMEHANLDTPLLSRAKLLTTTVVEGKAGEAPNYQLFFSFDPIPVKGREDYTAILTVNETTIGRYRFWLRSRYQDGFALTFNPQTQEFSNPSGGHVAAPFGLYVEEGWRGTPPRFHPVVLIHGMGGKPSDWQHPSQDYVSLITQMYATDEDFDYPSSWIHTYHYGFDEQGVYNYQGDVREIALGMESVVADLASQYAESFGESLESLESRGEDNVVDLVGYSLGGLVARQYLVKHKDNHHVRKLITIGTPHKGSWVMDFDEEIESLPLIGQDLENALSETLVGSYYALIGSDRPPDSDSPAAQQVVPESEFLRHLNQVSLTPLDVSYATIYGNIHASLTRKIFGWELSKELNLGDLVVLSDSSSYISGVEPDAYSMDGTTEFYIGVKLDGDEVSLHVEVPNLGSVQAFHTNLLKNELVQSEVVNLLSG